MRARLLALTVLATLAVAAPASAQLSLDGSPPSATFTWSPSQPTAGDLVTFTSTSDEGSGGFSCRFPSITAYRWDFDSNGTWDATGPTATRTFALPGAALVTHAVDSDCGLTGTRRELVVVRP